jgi:thioredoxin-like negative regulator of GroEL
MFKISKFISVILVLLTILILLVIAARKEAHHLKRDPEVLLNRYYLLKKSEPIAARKALTLVLQQDNQHTLALKELSQTYIKENKIGEALPLLEQLHHLEPNDQYHTLQLAHLYFSYGEWGKAQTLLIELKKGQSKELQIKAQIVLNQMASYVPYYQSSAGIVIRSQDKSEQSQIVTILWNLFYKLQKNDPKQARQLLTLLSMIDTSNTVIPLEMGYLALQQKNPKQASNYFLQSYNLNPSLEVALQLAYLYASQNQKKTAGQFFLLVLNSSKTQIKEAAAKGYAFVSQTPPAPKKIKTSQQDLLMAQFYLLKKYNKQASWQLIKTIIARYPTHFTALKEGGYLAIELHDHKQAIAYLTQAYELHEEPDLAMQLGYLYDGLNFKSSDKYWAYHYFHWATHGSNKDLELRAQNAMTNLSGLQTKVLPDPFFSELFFDPFTQNRFGLTVRPLVGRLGIEHHNRWQAKTYLVFRRTQDNKSINAGQVPQIYEDNVQILGVGEQVIPIPSFPLVGYIEAGRAYDLVYRDRNKWRNDLRAGLIYYNEFGARTAYFEHLTMNFNYYSTLYGDSIYFSRYNNNLIGTLKTHQGLRLIQYHSSMLNVYVSGRLIEDSNRVFFNNIAEIGPGIGFIPSNRYKIELRFEHINGLYLPAGGSINPYGKYYTNNMVQLLFYTKL